MTSIWGDNINGRQYSETRGVSMSVTAPPADYRWHHYEINTGIGNDSTISPLAKQTKEDLVEMRLYWLDQFDLEITEEGDYRVWRWYTGWSGEVLERTCVWWERRPIEDGFPNHPGLWPGDI